jgi:hypothetical protein
MSPSLFLPVLIGVGLIISGLLNKRFTFNSSWWFSMYTEEQRTEAKKYMAKLLVGFGLGFCFLGLLPAFFPQFKGLKTGTIAVLAVFSTSIIRGLTKAHIRKAFKQ